MTALLAAGALVAATPAGARAPVPTVVIFEGMDCMGSPTGPCLGTGWIESSRKRCLAGRTVKLAMVYSDRDPFVFDVDKTSRGGAYAGFGEIPDGNTVAARIRVTKKRFGRPGNRTTCAPASLGSS